MAIGGSFTFTSKQKSTEGPLSAAASSKCPKVEKTKLKAPYQREGWEQNQPEPAKISVPPSSYDVLDCTGMKKVAIFALLNLPVLAFDLPEKAMIFRLSVNL